MHGRPIRASLGSEPYGSALVCTGPKYTIAPIEKYRIVSIYIHTITSTNWVQWPLNQISNIYFSIHQGLLPYISVYQQKHQATFLLSSAVFTLFCGYVSSLDKPRNQHEGN